MTERSGSMQAAGEETVSPASSAPCNCLVHALLQTLQGDGLVGMLVFRDNQDPDARMEMRRVDMYDAYGAGSVKQAAT